ncbi:MAG: hypothetical protein Fur0018_00990 [Anaerolineales bacterium]
MRNETIWIVEHQPEIASSLALTIEDMGYTARIMESGGAALSASSPAPALILADLHLPGLTGKDLLVALKSQGILAPVIILSPREEPGDIIQAFRLGAADYLTLPVREAELVSTVTRVMEQHGASQERDSLLQQVQQANERLQRQIQDQQVIAALGKAVVATTDTHLLFQKIVDGAVHLCQADVGWLMVKHAENRLMVLAAFHGRPELLRPWLHRPWNDNVSLYVERQGKTLALNGKSLGAFALLKNIGQALLAAPLIIGSNEVSGVLVMLRTADIPFTEHDQARISAVADYAAIAMLNARMMLVLNERARRLERMTHSIKLSEHTKSSLLRNISMALREPLTSALGYSEMLLEEQLGALNKEQTQAMMIVRDKLAITSSVAEHLTAISDQDPTSERDEANLQAIIQRVWENQQDIAQHLELHLETAFHGRSDLLKFNPSHLERVIEAVLVNAFSLAPRGAHLLLETTATPEDRLCFSLRGQVTPLTTAQVKRLTHLDTQGLVQRQSYFTGISIGLSLAKEIAAFYGAELQVLTEQRDQIEFRLLFAAR